MEFKIKEGNYEKQGVWQNGRWTCFTFAGEKEDCCSVVLMNQNKEIIAKIEVPKQYCMGSLRSIAVADLATEDMLYAYEINGRMQLDPYARRIVGREIWNDETRMKEDVYGGFWHSNYAWGKDQAPEIDRSGMVMYKLHVRGFTMDAGQGKANGTFYALMGKIPYIKSLGVTTLELMPIYEFEERMFPEDRQLPEYLRWEKDEEDVIAPIEMHEARLKVNFWGYTKDNSYFAVKAAYARNPQNASREYKNLIRALHRNQIECVMELFFPDGTDQNLILEVLRFWVMEYHVDGFHLLGENLPITAIVQDRRLSRTKIFYTSFGEEKKPQRHYQNLYVYKEEYLYPARRVLNHFSCNLDEFIDQQRKQGSEYGFVNYICDNNGFTLADLFMYNDRHNEANGENNCDGSAWNFSNNYGEEGPTAKRYINRIRKKQWRNAILMLMLAQGVPLLWSGDEFFNSQKGNNNAYCQDNEIGWINWKEARSHRDLKKFVGEVAGFRRQHPVLSSPMPFQFSDYQSVGCPDLSFHGENAWMLHAKGSGLAIGMLYCGDYSPDVQYQEDVYAAYNFSSSEAVLALPNVGKNKGWYLCIDSANDKNPFLDEPEYIDEGSIRLMPQSISVLAGRDRPRKRNVVARQVK